MRIIFVVSPELIGDTYKMRHHPMPRTADAVVIGGGIVGCFTALGLAERNMRTVVIEKGSIGGEQSSRNWGFILQQGRQEAEMPLIAAAARAWAGLESQYGIDVEYRQSGNLGLQDNEDSLSRGKDWAVKAEQYGIPAEILDGHDIGDRLPGSDGSWAGGLFTPSDGQADPLRATREVARVGQQQGVTFATGTTATRVLVDKGKVVGVATQSGVISTDVVVLCGGAWTRRMLLPLGVNLPIQWLRSTVGETAPVSDFPDIPTVWTPDVAFRKTRNSTLVFAAGGRSMIDIMPSALNNIRLFVPILKRNLSQFRVRVNRSAVLGSLNYVIPGRRFVGWEPQPTQANIRRGFAALQTMYPRLAAVPVARAWAGYIDGTPDGHPVISSVEGIEGLVVGSGFSGHGFGAAPAGAKALAELAETGSSQSLDISQFALNRFSRADYRPHASISIYR